MQYLIYFAVATPLLLVWLFWQAAGVPPPPPMFHSFADTLHAQAMLKQAAEQALSARARRVQQPQPAREAERTARNHGLEHTARATSDDMRLR